MAQLHHGTGPKQHYPAILSLDSQCRWPHPLTAGKQDASCPGPSQAHAEALFQSQDREWHLRWGGWDPWQLGRAGVGHGTTGQPGLHRSWAPAAARGGMEGVRGLGGVKAVLSLEDNTAGPT